MIRIKGVTEKKPTKERNERFEFGMKVVKYVKSNAIVIVKDGQLLELVEVKLIEFGQL